MEDLLRRAAAWLKAYTMSNKTLDELDKRVNPYLVVNAVQITGMVVGMTMENVTPHLVQALHLSEANGFTAQMVDYVTEQIDEHQKEPPAKTDAALAAETIE